MSASAASGVIIPVVYMRSLFSQAQSTPASGIVCTITAHTSLRLGNLCNEKATQLRVRKAMRQATPGGGFIFDITTLSRVQTPTQGAGQLTAELAPLLDALVVETDAAGRLLRVLNKAALRQQWAALKPELQAKYRRNSDVPPKLLHQLGQVLDEDDALETALANSSEYGLLFQPPYGLPFSADVPVPGTAVLPHFVGEIDLPLRTESLCEINDLSPGATGAVRVAGEIDLSRYRAADARRALCALTDEPNLDARVQVLHHERYTFGSQYELVEATRHTRADVPGVMSRQVTVLLHTRDQ